MFPKPPNGMSTVKTLRLWLSHQRYAVLALAIGMALMVWVYCIFGNQWWAVLPVGCLTLASFILAFRILAQGPRKMRVTHRALRRITEGTFEPASVSKYCTDPCWRVVVDDILREFGLPIQKRRALIEEYTAAAQAAGATLIMVNRHDNVLYTMEDGLVRKTSLEPRTRPT